MADYQFVYIAPLVMGLAIGIVELIFVKGDEQGMGWLGHGLHALPTAMIFTFISMNIPFVMQQSFMSWMPAWAANYAIPIILGIVAAAKVKAAAAIVQGGKVGESWYHALIIGALIAAAPIIWHLVVVPNNMLPAYLMK